MRERTSPEPSRVDAALLGRAQAGDRAAVTEVVRRLARSVHAMVARLAGARRDLVEDAAQDAFVKIVRGLHRFAPDGPARFETWALTVAARATIDRLRGLERRGRHLVALDAPPEGVAPGPSPERTAADRELGARVVAAMEALPAEHRAVLVLRAYHDLDYPEIAEATGLPIGTVKSRLARARAALKAAVAEENRHGE